MSNHNSCGLCSIEMKNISVTSGEDILLDNINLTFHCGELTALIGKTAQGKPHCCVPFWENDTIKGAFPLQTTMALCCRCRGLAMCRSIWILTRACRFPFRILLRRRREAVLSGLASRKKCRRTSERFWRTWNVGIWRSADWGH